jgi:hypothetical protein
MVREFQAPKKLFDQSVERPSGHDLATATVVEDFGKLDPALFSENIAKNLEDAIDTRGEGGEGDEGGEGGEDA